jgi:hypothetical protein
MSTQKVQTHFVCVEFVLPSGLLEGFNEPTPIGVLVLCDGLKVCLMDDAGDQSGWISGVNGWANHKRLGHDFFLHGYSAQSLAVAWAGRSTTLAVRAGLVPQTISAPLVFGKTICLVQ